MYLQVKQVLANLVHAVNCRWLEVYSMILIHARPLSSPGHALAVMKEALEDKLNCISTFQASAWPEKVTKQSWAKSWGSILHFNGKNYKITPKSLDKKRGEQNIIQPWPVWLDWSVFQWIHQKVAGSILCQGTYLGCGFVPCSGCMRRATDQCFSLPLMFLSLFL